MPKTPAVPLSPSRWHKPENEESVELGISRAKWRIARLALDQPGDLGTVLRVLYFVFNEGYSGNVDLAAEAIRLTLPHPAARQPVSRHSLDYCAFRDSSGSSGCMVSSSDLGGGGSGRRGGGDRGAWSGTGQPTALPDRAAVTATRPDPLGGRLPGAGQPARPCQGFGGWAPGCVRPVGVVAAGVEHQRQPRDEGDCPGERDEDDSKGGSRHVSNSVQQHRGRRGHRHHCPPPWAL